MATFGRARFPVSIVWLMKRTEASPIRQLTPPGWKLLGGVRGLRESEFPLVSSTHPGALGGRMVLNATFSIWPSAHWHPKRPLT